MTFKKIKINLKAMVSTFNDGYEVRRLMGDVMSDDGIKYGYGCGRVGFVGQIT